MTNRELIAKYDGIAKAQRVYFNIKGNGTAEIADNIVSPLMIDNRQLCSMTQNQGDRPYCAAYGATNLAEAIIWKKTGHIYDINPEQIYAGAKKIDGIVDDDGTYLEAALRSAFNLGCFDITSCRIQTLVNDGTDEFVAKIKHAIHKYDLLLGGWNISDEYYKMTKTNCYLDKVGQPLGGHCMIICGYDPSGVYIQNSWGRDYGANGFFIESWPTFKKDFIYAAWLSTIFDGFEK